MLHAVRAVVLARVAIAQVYSHKYSFKRHSRVLFNCMFQNVGLYVEIVPGETLNYAKICTNEL